MERIEPLPGELAGTGSTVKGKIKTAKKLPYWLWVVIAKLLGIKLYEKDRPIISAILHVLTFGSALGLFVTNAWFSGCNIVSVHTKSDILDGTVSIMVISFFCGLGVYSHRLAYRLFIHPKFLDMLRLHSKTIFKMNSAFVIFVVLFSYVVVLNISTFHFTYSFTSNSTGDNKPVSLSNSTHLNPCQLVDISVKICQVYWGLQVLYSVFFLVWNLLVAVVLVSVARTQTISIRRFLKELEIDAQLMDQKIGTKYNRQDAGIKNQYVWRDDDSLADFFSNTNMEESRSSESGDSFSGVQLRIGGEQANQTPRFERMIEEEENSSKPHILSTQEIMHKYWSINMSVRLASVALQRWMSSITLMITAWSSSRMVYWLSHSPSLSGVFMFILPLLLLPLLASSYSEVNYEGGRILQSILPTAERIHMFQYLYGQPIQMTVYGHAVTYGTIGTVVAGILAAFTSKIFLQEINSIS